jgi:transcriptional regulator with XRE-family HTH domain
MGQNEGRLWASEVAAQVGKNIQRARKNASMSAQDVSNASEGLGYPIPRSTIANIESGRKETVALQELLVIAEVLGVPPLTLVYFPDDAGIAIEKVPGKSLLTVDAASEFTSDRRVARSEVARRQVNVQSLRTYEERAAFSLGQSAEILAGTSEPGAWWMDERDSIMMQDDPGLARDFARRESEHLLALALTAVRRASSIREALSASGVTLWEIPESLTSTYAQVAAEADSSPATSS